MSDDNVKLEVGSDSPCPHCASRTKERNQDEYNKLINRLNRIEGQIRGIKNMVEKNAYCPDILTQAAAVTAAMSAFSKELLSSHIRTCVVHDLSEGKTETAEELITTIQRFMK